jgi:hypothetical protein
MTDSREVGLIDVKSDDANHSVREVANAAPQPAVVLKIPMDETSL